MPVRKLLESPYAILTHDTDTGIVCLRRTSQRFPVPDGVGKGENQALARALAELDAALASLDTARVGILVDLRDAPAPSSEQYERSMEPLRHTVRRFKTTAALVQTVAGKLQVQRLARQDGANLAVFTDESAARTHLLELLKKRR
jgi:hypothetical protein